MAAVQLAQCFPDGTFGPGMPVTRAQMASFIARLIEAAGGDLPDDPPGAFDDDEGSVHEHSIDRLAAVGIVEGRSGRTFEPSAMVTRAQMASFLVRAYEHLTGATLASSGDAFGYDAGSVHEETTDRNAEAGLHGGRPEGGD